MEHRGFIGQRPVRAFCEYVVYSDERGVIAECPSFETAWESWEKEQAQRKQWGMEPNLAILHWSGGRWVPAISLYDLQEADLLKNPTRIVHLP